MNWVAAREACKEEIVRHQKHAASLHYESSTYHELAVTIRTLQSLYMILHAGTTTPNVEK